MGIETALIIGGIGLGLGAVAGGTAAVISAAKGGSDKAPDVPTKPATPNPQDSLAKAQADAQNKKRAAIASGGDTIATGGQGATLLSGQTAKKTLLG